jgi:nucleoside-diphosphate-sugar epimerase
VKSETLYLLRKPQKPSMVKEKILVVGASGQIGVELTLALRKIYGNANVVASDLREENQLLKGSGPYVPLDIMNKEMLHVQVIRQNVTQIYLLAAILSATGEKNPNLAWNLNMQGLLNVLDIAKEEQVRKVYWPSSIAVFGPTSPKKNCPQQTIIEPTTVYGISKYAGEFWCNYYHHRYGVDVRSLRYPGLISYKSGPGGGTTDYAIEIFQEAVEEKKIHLLFKKGYVPADDVHARCDPRNCRINGSTGGEYFCPHVLQYFFDELFARRAGDRDKKVYT